MKKYAILVATVLVVATLTLAGPVKTWTSGETITAADINANFAHIHNLMVGGHGARLVNGDISSGANIAHSKLATPGLVAKSIFQVGSGTTACAAGTCTLSGSAGVVPVVTWLSTGLYDVTIAARANANYVPIVTPQYCGNPTGGCSCNVQAGLSTTLFTVACTAITTNTPPVLTRANTVFGVAIFDDNN